MAEVGCHGVPNDFLTTAKLARRLGSGTYGIVKLLETPDKRRYAAKYQEYSESRKGG